MQTSKKFKYNKIDIWKLKKMDQNSLSKKENNQLFYLSNLHYNFYDVYLIKCRFSFCIPRVYCRGDHTRS